MAPPAPAPAPLLPLYARSARYAAYSVALFVLAGALGNIFYSDSPDSAAMRELCVALCVGALVCALASAVSAIYAAARTLARISDAIPGGALGCGIRAVLSVAMALAAEYVFWARHESSSLAAAHARRIEMSGRALSELFAPTSAAGAARAEQAAALGCTGLMWMGAVWAALAVLSAVGIE